MKYLMLAIFLTINASQLKAQIPASVEGNVDNLPVREYDLTINKKMVNITGREVMGMAINGTIPGPTLRFTEGEYAVISVTNVMETETSVHWHGLLLPNFYDGVPYLSTPPILPGETFTYEFAIKQSGTYWYHSHTMLQEQSGVFGSIVIEPKEKTLGYDSDLVIVFSDWTDDKPMNVLRNLKRGNEWFGIKKGTSTPLNQVIARGAFGAQINFWKQRMEGADIADIYYPAFLTNGAPSHEYSDFKSGEKIRVRFINAAASTYFWLTFGGEAPLLVASDGLDVVPVHKDKLLFAIAETYDFIVTIPANGKLEIRATAQDGSGQTAAFLGKGDVLAAPDVPKPDKIGMMKSMAKMKMKMGAPALKANPKKDNRFAMKKKYGMQMDQDMDMEGMNHKDMKEMKQENTMEMPEDTMPQQKMKMDMPMDTIPDDKMKMDMSKSEMPSESMSGMNMSNDFGYNFLKSPKKTTYPKDTPVKEILLNLTGNMNRYIWSLNGVPLSETDKIKIKEGEVTRIRLNNLTMMHHPMHLHGHFFRVLNKNGEYSPLKHTVNVPPMQEVTIEFYGNEYGDWFFHCHILYHMMGGMARVFSYDTPRDKRMDNYPVSMLVHETDLFYTWGTIDAASQMTGLNLVSSNIRNQFNLNAEFGYNKNLEAEFTYERYLYDYARVFGGVNVENKIADNLDTLNVIAVAGMRFLTPYLFKLDVRVDNKLRPRIGIGRSIMLFPRFSVFGYYEYQVDFGAVNDLENNKNYSNEIVWSAGAEYILSKNFSLTGSYDNRFGVGGGVSIRF
jgi:CopA family copper-resistance protein